ncbi:hypothetical protein [Brevundimonas sp. Bb-A]|uniref:hypothetical protein n=1 Tax=Brevundimonas sp. Bb-A TaxID=2560058 RepID=UPI00128FC69B|nr:hypothetical protein [Brevundimonas sp. Bb-A]
MTKTMLNVYQQQTIVQRLSKAVKGETMRTVDGWSLATLVLALCVPTLARAQDQECGDIGAIVRQAYPNAVADGERTMKTGNRTLTLPSPSSINPHAIVCRRWRGRPGLLLVAIPLIAEVGVDSTLGDLDVLVVDEPTGTPRHRLRIPHAMDDDAVRISRISFDTAPYRFGPDRLAFGVRREWVGCSRPNPFMETTLSLYEPRGAALAPVLDDLIVERSQGQWDLSCAGETVVTERILRMVPGQKGQDISVLERITQSTSREAKNGECSTTDQAVAPRTIRLSFDGKRYDVPRLIQRR